MVVLKQRLAVAGEVLDLDGRVEFSQHGRVGEVKPQIDLHAGMAGFVAEAQSRGQLDFFPGIWIVPCYGRAQVGITAVVSNVRVVVTDDKIEPGARLEGKLEIVRQVNRGGGLQVARIEAALPGTTTAIGFMFATELQIELEEFVAKHVGVIEEPRRFVAGIVEGRIPDEGRPERGLRISKIQVRQRIRVALEIEDFVFQAHLKFHGGMCAGDEENRLVEGQVRPEIFAQLIHGCRVGPR